MKADLIDALTAPKSDPEFGSKYGITVLCTMGSVLVIPAVILAGYFAQTVKHASAGKKGLPAWKAVPELTVQGGICLLSGLFLLPAALLLAIAYLPLMMGGTGFWSMSAMLSRFITFGALVVGLGGLAFSLTGMHTYLHSRRISDMFNISKITTKMKAHANELGMLLTMAGVASAALYIVNVLLGWPGAILTLFGSAFLNLVIAYGIGNIYGTETEEQTAVANDQAAAAALPVAESEPAAPLAEEEDTWKPK